MIRHLTLFLLAAGGAPAALAAAPPVSPGCSQQSVAATGIEGATTQQKLPDALLASDLATVRELFERPPAEILSEIHARNGFPWQHGETVECGITRPVTSWVSHFHVDVQGVLDVEHVYVMHTLFGDTSPNENVELRPGDVFHSLTARTENGESKETLLSDISSEARPVAAVSNTEKFVFTRGGLSAVYCALERISNHPESPIYTTTNELVNQSLLRMLGARDEFLANGAIEERERKPLGAIFNMWGCWVDEREVNETVLLL